MSQLPCQLFFSVKTLIFLRRAKWKQLGATISNPIAFRKQKQPGAFFTLLFADFVKTIAKELQSFWAYFCVLL